MPQYKVINRVYSEELQKSFDIPYEKGTTHDREEAVRWKTELTQNLVRSNLTTDNVIIVRVDE
jgi:hypothetical protein